MRRLRVVAALAAILTALLLQATLVGPLTLPVQVSLPAVLVAAVALTEGPAAGMSFGFAAGLIADLGSTHPAGVLALTWLAVGVGCGVAAEHRSVRADAALAAVACALAGVGSTLLLTAVHATGATAWPAVRDAIPAGLGAALLALGVVPLVRAFLRSAALRPPSPFAELRAHG